MHPNYPNWLAEQGYAANVQKTRASNLAKVEKYYGDLKERFLNGTLGEVLEALQYSAADERAGRDNPSKIKFNGDNRTNLAMYKNAVGLYLKFLKDSEFSGQLSEKNSAPAMDDLVSSDEKLIQRFSLERDMQTALRLNIKSLHPDLKIIDDGAERSVDSGLVDITCENGEAIVVVELKAGKADSRSIGQILGYMADLQELEDRPVQGILVAHDFDKRVKSAARMVPGLRLIKYSIEFKFSAEN